MSLNCLFLVLFLKVYFICCCSITNTVISLVTHNKLKVHRANSQTISSHPFRFSTDIFFSSFAFSCFVFLVCLFGVFLGFFSLFFLKSKIYIMIHIRLCGRVSARKIFTRPISGNKTTFFGLSKTC